jgi:lipopolysaccharide/colanic/teichoic acid biosynthesis glycosyltransferase
MVAVLITAPLFLAVAIVLLACGVRSVLSIERALGERSTFPLVRFHVPPALRARLIGRILVGSGLVALPQVFSVLHGHMSLIGPRPRHEGDAPPPARPGLVGLAQNAQAHGPITRSEQYALDAQYARDCSFRLDAQILATCVWQAFVPPR